jgi:hypothetical protein
MVSAPTRMEHPRRLRQRPSLQRLPRPLEDLYSEATVIDVAISPGDDLEMGMAAVYWKSSDRILLRTRVLPANPARMQAVGMTKPE